MTRIVLWLLIAAIGLSIWSNSKYQHNAVLVKQIKTDIQISELQVDVEQLKQTDADLLEMIRAAKKKTGIQYAFSPTEPSKFFVLDSGQDGKCGDLEGLIRDGEGTKVNKNGLHIPYLDTSDKCKHARTSGQCKTIGVGFCLDCGFCEKIGCKWDGKPIDDKTASDWFARYMANAEKEIKTVVPCYDELPTHVKAVIGDIWWTTGTRGLGSFENTITNICERKYSSAAQRIKQSKWCVRDVKEGRCNRNTHILTTGQMVCKNELKNGVK